MSQKYLIMCDNKNCDYKIPNDSKDANASIKQYLNMPCPICGKNLLTEQDYKDSLALLNVINWLNKWFSWITIFIPKSKEVSATAHTHNGVKIEIEE